MAKLNQTSITGSLNVSGSTIIMPNLTASVDSGSAGQLWIDESPGLFMKFTTPSTSLGTIQSPASFMGAWSAGGTMIKARENLGAAGSQDAALAFGGYGGGMNSCTEEYDGSSWSAGGALIIARAYGGGTGTQNEAIWIGGYVNSNLTSTEEYNGSSWSTGGALITQRGGNVGAAGTQNAALGWGGYSPSILSSAEEYNGSSWSAGGALIRAISYVGGTGTQNAALSAGGTTPGTPSNPKIACVEGYDGTSWSALNSLASVGRRSAGAAGTIHAAVIFGGGTPTTIGNVEEYNGLSWVNGCNMTIMRAGSGGTGTQNAGLASGGNNPSIGLVSTAEEYNKNDILPYTTCVWSANNALIKSRVQIAGFGVSANATVQAGGQNSGPSYQEYSCVEEWDGTSFSSATALSTARYGAQSAGSATAGLVAAGDQKSPGPVQSVTEEYNGSSWSSGGNVINARVSGASAGSQNSALLAGGQNPGVINCAETYNGTSWSSITALPAQSSPYLNTHVRGGGASSDAAAVAGGYPTATRTIEWDGSSWSSGGNMNTGRSVFGTFPSAPIDNLTVFGNVNITHDTEIYNGTAWSVGGNLIQASKMSIAGGNVGGLYAGAESAVETPAPMTQLYQAVCSTTMCSAAGAWSVTNKNITPRTALGFSGNGTQNAVWLAGGGGPGLASPQGTNATELYDGTSWTTGNNISTARLGRASTGTQNAGLLAGGFPFTTATEEFDGTTWSGGGSMSNSLYCRTAGGLQNDAIAFGGSPTQICTEEYNGTSWSSGGAFPLTPGGVGTKIGNAVGTTVNDIISTDRTSESISEKVTQYDGTSWSELTSKNSKRSAGGAAGSTQAAVVFGGYKNPGASPYSCNITYTEEWNGATWSHGCNTNTSTNLIGGAGSQNAAIMQAGNSYTGYTEEFTCTLTGNYAGAWSLGGSLITARMTLAGAGTQNAGLASGGETPTKVTCTEEYNGSTWSAGGALITARSYLAGAGTQNAGITFGGYSPSNVTCTEEYNGSSWSAGGAMIIARRNLAGAGTQNAGITFGGYSNAAINNTEEYDGSTWSAGGTLITARYALAGAGTQNAGLAFGGESPVYSCTEEYDGSTWTAGNGLLTARFNHAGAGTQNAGMTFGGATPTVIGSTENYNGIGWSIGCTLNTIRNAHAGAGLQDAALAFGGEISPAKVSCTEEFTCNTLLGAGLKCSVKTIS